MSKKRTVTRKCQKFKDLIEESLKNKLTISDISRKIDCSWNTVFAFVKEAGLSRYRTGNRQTRDRLESKKDEIIEYLRTARRLDYACRDLDCPASALRNFMANHNIVLIRRKGFVVPQGNKAAPETPESKNIDIVSLMREEDRERTKNYLTIDDFNRMYGDNY